MSREQGSSNQVFFEAAGSSLAQTNLVGIDFFGHHIDVDAEAASTPERIKSIALAGCGETTVAIGGLLHVTAGTIGRHLAAGYRDLDARNGRHAVRRLFEANVLRVTLPDPQRPLFTHRRRAALHYMSHGLSRADAARRMGVSENTVRAALREAAATADTSSLGTEATIMIAFCTGDLRSSIV